MPEHIPAPTPNRAVYGFIFSLVFRILFIIYLIWTLCPQKWFIAFILTCLPDRYWSVAVPLVLLTVLATFAFIIYPSMGLLMTPKWDDIRTIIDKSVGEQTIHNDAKLDFLKGNLVLNKENCYCHTGRKCKKQLLNTTHVNEYQSQQIPKLEDLDVISVTKQMYLSNK